MKDEGWTKTWTKNTRSCKARSKQHAMRKTNIISYRSPLTARLRYGWSLFSLSLRHPPGGKVLQLVWHDSLELGSIIVKLNLQKTPDYNDTFHILTNENDHYLRVSDACIVGGGGGGALYGLSRYVLPHRVRLLNSFDLQKVPGLNKICSSLWLGNAHFV